MRTQKKIIKKTRKEIIKRTQQEIINRIQEITDDDFFGFQTTDLVSYLTYKNAKPFLKDTVTRNQWKRQTKTPKQLMIDYMAFAWEKANNKRGLSASRTIDHYISWLWLDGNDTLCNAIKDYNYYGKPQLVEICKYLGLDSNTWDN